MITRINALSLGFTNAITLDKMDLMEKTKMPSSKLYIVAQ
jgi:hypothetical protein